MKLDVSVDAFNFLNRSNVDEITPVYGSPVFCGNAIPRRYKDAVSRAIQAQSATMACPNGVAGETPVIVATPGGPLQVGNTAATPIPLGAGSSLFIPLLPDATFGLPRTMLNPRQFQIAAKFSF